MRKTRLCTVLALCLLAVSAQAQPKKGPPPADSPDLVIQGPDVGDTKAMSWMSVAWTVRNIGQKPSTSSQIEITCAPVYVEGSQTQCGDSPVRVDIPPLAHDDTYVVKTNALAFVENPKDTPLYRLTLKAIVDPDKQVAELNEFNNELIYTAQNFQGPVPSGKPMPPSSNSGSVSSGSVPPPPKKGAQAASKPIGKVAAHLSITTDPSPWDPAKKAWIVVKNVGQIASPAATLIANCEMSLSGPSGKAVDTCYPINGPFGQPQVLYPDAPYSAPVPPLNPGQFKAIYEIGPASGPHFVVGSGAAYFEGSKTRFNINGEGVFAQDLLLSTYTLKIAPKKK